MKSKPARKKLKTPPGGASSKSRSLAEILVAAEDAPEVFKRWAAGRPGRWPKLTVDEYEAELGVAIDVERARIAYGITKSRTPAHIYEEVGKKHDVSGRSARRFYGKHREDALSRLRFLKTLPERQREILELMAIYGSEIGRVPMRLAHRLHQILVAQVEGSPSEMARLQYDLGQFLARKPKNVG